MAKWYLSKWFEIVLTFKIQSVKSTTVPNEGGKPLQCAEYHYFNIKSQSIWLIIKSIHDTEKENLLAILEWENFLILINGIFEKIYNLHHT